MKKIFGLMLLCATLVGFVSCEKENGSDNPLKGTLWSYDDEVTVFEKNEFTRYIEFVDNQNVNIWDTDGSGPYTGTYKVDGNTVYFYNLYNAYWLQYYVKGTFTSRSMTVYFSYDYSPDTGYGNLYNDVFTKE